MAKQSDLPNVTGKGVAPVRITQLDKLAEAYTRERDKRLKQTPAEVAAKQKLIDALHAHADQLRTPDGDLIYRYDEMMITLSPGKEKLRVEALSLEPEEE
jgi:hypothetical protein